MINKDIYQALQQLIPNEKIKVDEPLKRYTYTKTGGNADFYITPTKNEEVQAVVKYAYQNEIPVTYLGNGSNIIIREGGIRGIVISLLSLDHIEVSDDAIIAGSVLQLLMSHVLLVITHLLALNLHVVFQVQLVVQCI